MAEVQTNPPLDVAGDEGVQKETTKEEQLMATAIKFLQNPKVRSSPLAQKKAFLKSKGLTDEQIAQAIHDSGLISEQPPLPPPIPFWKKAQRTSVFILVISGATYGMYQLYIKFIRPYFYGLEEKKGNTESEVHQSLKAITESVQSMQATLAVSQENIKEILSSVQNNQISQRLKETDNFQDIKSEIASVKSLLLSRRSFPPPPNLGSGLPAWQLQQTTENNNDSTDNGTNGRSWEVVNEDTESGSSRTQSV